MILKSKKLIEKAIKNEFKKIVPFLKAIISRKELIERIERLEDENEALRKESYTALSKLAKEKNLLSSKLNREISKRRESEKAVHILGIKLLQIAREVKNEGRTHTRN